MVYGVCQLRPDRVHCGMCNSVVFPPTWVVYTKPKALYSLTTKLSGFTI